MGDSAAYRPAPVANGTLAKTPLVHLLVYVHDKKLSGTVELITSDKRGNASIFFIFGEPAKIRSSTPMAYLGEVLRDLRYLTDEQLAASLTELQAAKAAGRALHGEMLLGRGLIDRRKLETGLREQVARKVRLLATMPPDTVYGFYEGFDGLRGWGGEVEQGFDPFPMLWETLRDNPPLEHVAAGLARIGGAQLKVVKSADVLRLGLGEAGRKVAEALAARPTSVRDLQRETGLAEQDVRLIAYLMLVTKQVEVLRAGGAPPVAPTNSSGEHRRASVPVTHSVHPQNARSKSPVPGAGNVSIPAPAPPPPGLSPELSARWQEIVDRAVTIDRADYFMMLELARDATHDEIEATFFSLAKKWHPDRLPVELAPVRDACSRVFARMSEAHSTLADDEQRKQYMGLLADGSGSPEMQETVAKVIEAATDFQKAEVCFKRNDQAQAELWCRKAVNGDPSQAQYRALLAWLIALKPENQAPDKTLESVKMLDKAIGQNDRSDNAHFWRGMLYKRLGKEDLALRDFRRVVDLNPRNIDAARELRLHEMRGPKAASASARPAATPPPPRAEDAAKSGIFGRLFKK